MQRITRCEEISYALERARESANDITGFIYLSEYLGSACRAGVFHDRDTFRSVTELAEFVSLDSAEARRRVNSWYNVYLYDDKSRLVLPAYPSAVPDVVYTKKYAYVAISDENEWYQPVPRQPEIGE